MTAFKLAIVGFKGGIGKTTTCVNLGAALAHQGQQVLLIDTDTQANVSPMLGLENPGRGLADVLLGYTTPAEVVISARPNLNLMGGGLNLFKAQQRMVSELGRETMFSRLLTSLPPYDVHVIDCGPSLSLLTVNAILYADALLTPVGLDVLSLSGVQQLSTYLQELADLVERPLRLSQLVPTMFKPQVNLQREILQALQQRFGEHLAQPIHYTAALPTATSQGETIFEYAPRSRAALDYARLSEEIIALMPSSNSTVTDGGEGE